RASGGYLRMPHWGRGVEGKTSIKWQHHTNTNLPFPPTPPRHNASGFGFHGIGDRCPKGCQWAVWGTMNEYAYAVPPQQRHNAIDDASNVLTGLVRALGTVRIIQEVTNGREDVVDRRNRERFSSQNIRTPYVDYSKTLGAFNLQQQSFGTPNETLVRVEAIVVYAVALWMDAIDRFDHFIGGIALPTANNHLGTGLAGLPPNSTALPPTPHGFYN